MIGVVYGAKADRPHLVGAENWKGDDAGVWTLWHTACTESVIDRTRGSQKLLLSPYSQRLENMDTTESNPLSATAHCLPANDCGRGRESARVPALPSEDFDE